MNRTRVWLAFSIAISAAGFGTVSVAGDDRTVTGAFRRTVDVPATATLQIANGIGQVVITRGEPNKISIAATMRTRSRDDRPYPGSVELLRRLEANPPIEQSGANIRIGHELEEEDRVSIVYEIHVPAGTTIKTRTGVGDLEIDGIRGSLDASARHGNIDAREVKGELHVETGTGDISAHGEQTGRWNLESRHGGIRVQLPRDANFQLDAHADRGEVIFGRAVAMTVEGPLARGRVTGTTRGTGPVLRVHTGTGTIRID